MTHPFHPLYGQVFGLVMCRHTWGEARVYYHDAAGSLRSLPTAWTSLAPVDPFVGLSAGRAAFRVSDLVELAHVLASLTEASEV